ncbi:hypothetical protein ACIPLC_34500 [Kitasatospora sp. NPDC086801]|uniref:hypothetical protein n=1 Tax=Kitasatospora sp. NPDC086801 TaxID=3364066 RepID=UPI0037FE6DC7
MRLTDSRTGRSCDIHPAHRGLLRVTVHAGHPARPFDLSDLRALLVADVLRRVGEFGGDLQVSLTWVLPDLPAPLPAPLAEAPAREAYRLGVRPPDSTEDDGSADLRILASGTDTDRSAGTVLTVAPARPPVPGTAETPLGFLDALTAEPLAVRLALLRHPYRASVDLADPLLTDAQRALDRWRQLVAQWSEEPSLPSLTDPVRRARAAFGDDLDTSTALDVLEHTAAGTEPAGARFETFVRVDRVLGLELSRDVGRAAA